MIICNQTDILARRFSLEEALQRLKEAGFDAADLSLFDTPDNPRWSKETYKKEAIRIGEYARSIGLPILQAHAYFPPSTLFKKLPFEEILELTDRGVEIAALAGAKVIVVHPLHYGEYNGHEEEWFERNMAYYARFKPICEQYGVQVCVENMWKRNAKRGFMIDHDTCSRPEEFIRYLDTLNADGKNHFTACLDLGHMVLVGEDPVKMIQKLGNRIGALHVHDNNYHDDSHTLPGLGAMPYEAVCAALKRSGYQGIFTLEADNFIKNLPDALLPSAVRFMAENARHYASLCE